MTKQKAEKILKQVQNDKNVETGRSMTEMLGTLAIIGVLSVGAIAGYRYAMDNYYTNEILAGASQRAVVIASQIAAGRQVSLTEFDGQKEVAGGTFDGTVEKWDDEFGIQVSGVKESVCKNLIKATKDTDIIITDTNGVDLAESDCSGDENTFLFVYSNDMGDIEDTACIGVECPDGSTCSRGQCQCSNGLFVCGTQCCAEGTYCTGPNVSGGSNTCAEPTGEGDCTKNSDCKDAEGNVDISKYCHFSGGDCTNPGTGTCTDKGELDDTNDFTVKTLNLPGGALTVYKGGKMSWWSASNLCQAHGKQMVTMSDLGLADSGTNTSCYFDKTHPKYATQPCICNGGSDSGCSATNAGIRTNTGALGTDGNLWLADNGKSNSCTARYMTLSSGTVGRLGARKGNKTAICR